MFSSYKVVNPSFGYRAFAAPPCFAKLAYSHASLALFLPCQSRSVRAVRPAPLAAGARYSACLQSPVKVGASCSRAVPCHEQDRGLRPRRFGWSGSVSRHFIERPVSQRLKPQCGVVKTRSNAKPFAAPVKLAALQPWRLATGVSASKAKRQVIQQPPNPSFKRTRLRRSA